LKLLLLKIWQVVAERPIVRSTACVASAIARPTRSMVESAAQSITRSMEKLMVSAAKRIRSVITKSTNHSAFLVKNNKYPYSNDNGIKSTYDPYVHPFC
jgi:hypothetical protein